jgi:hypothetical protein
MGIANITTTSLCAPLRKAGQALAKMRESRLYREDYNTFEEFCRKRWKMGRHLANKLIAAAEVAQNLVTIGHHPAPCPHCTNEMTWNDVPICSNCGYVLTEGEQRLAETLLRSQPVAPTSERQVRPLAKLPPEEQREVWKAATTNGRFG